MTLKSPISHILWGETPGHLEAPLPVTSELSPALPPAAQHLGPLVLPRLHVAAGELSWGGGWGRRKPHELT